MRKECPTCKGRGSTLIIDTFLAVITLGFTALIDAGFDHRRECKVCDGKGYLLENGLIKNV